jgi:ribA/ribD-fused uncharacterized protein
MQKIESFTGQYRFLSNFYLLPSPIRYEGIFYPTVEHAYQAAKTLDKWERLRISKLPTPGVAKREGRKVKLQPDWDEMKLTVMGTLLWMKFSIPEFRKKLIDTGDAELIHGNYWGDMYWGVCHDKGENYLGQILMNIRKALP